MAIHSGGSAPAPPDDLRRSRPCRLPSAWARHPPDWRVRLSRDPTRLCWVSGFLSFFLFHHTISPSLFIFRLVCSDVCKPSTGFFLAVEIKPPSNCCSGFNGRISNNGRHNCTLRFYRVLGLPQSSECVCFLQLNPSFVGLSVPLSEGGGDLVPSTEFVIKKSNHAFRYLVRSINGRLASMASAVDGERESQPRNSRQKRVKRAEGGMSSVDVFACLY